MSEEKFVEELSKIGINLNEKQIKQLKEYCDLIIEWNDKINLTAITDPKDIYLKHFYDSLTLFKAIDLNRELNLCDVGSGAGFPGIVLKIVYPNLEIVLVDSLNKRVTFLNTVIKKLHLEKIEAIHERAEIYAKENREKYDLVTARAVANLTMLSELCIPLVKEKGYFIAMKSNNKQEIDDSYQAIKELGGKIEKIINFKLPYENSDRSLVKIRKEKKTPKTFPRRYSDIKNKPLK